MSRTPAVPPAPPEPPKLRLRGTGGAVIEYDLTKLNEFTVAHIREGRLQPADTESAKALAAAGFGGS